MFSEPQEVISDAIKQSLKRMRFDENLARALTSCVEGVVWDSFLDNKKGFETIELDFRVTFKDVSVDGGKREFAILINSVVGGKVINPEVIRRILPLADLPEEEERKCTCDNTAPMVHEDGIHCAYCGGVYRARQEGS